MDSLRPIRLRLSEKLADVEYFSKFFDERTRDEVATQLRELRELRGLSQVKFATESGMHQSAVSRIEQSDYSGWTYKTLLRAAQTLRARLKIEFVPAERVINEYKAREAERESTAEASEAVYRAMVQSAAGSGFSSGPDASFGWSSGPQGDGHISDISAPYQDVTVRKHTTLELGA